MLSAVTIQRYTTAPYAIFNKSEKTYSTVSLDEVYLHHLGISIALKLSRVSFHLFHQPKISKGMGWSQSMFCFQRSCMIYFASIKAGVRMPNRFKIELTKLSIPRFVLGTSLFITLILNASCSGYQNIPNVHSIDVWFKSKFTSLFFNGNSFVVYFSIS